jgi:uncharacterized protein (DUF2345 family)
VNSNVTARIHVTGDVSLTGKNDEIRLAAVGTKVTLDMGGTTFKMNGHFNFHYDEALSRLGGDRGFLPVSWAELN